MKCYSLSLVVPVYNEEELLEEFISRSMNDLERVSDDFEIILVNDGSTDRTLEISQRICSSNKNLRLISLEKNSGVGVATKVGLKAAVKEIIFNNTVDAFFNTEELPRFLSYIDDYDVLSGYRTNLKSNNLYGKILTVGNFYLIKILFMLNLRAVQTAQFFKKKVLDSIEIESNSTFVAPELLIKAAKLGYRIKEIGTVYQKRKAGKGKCGKISNVLDSFMEIIHFWYKWILSENIKRASGGIVRFAKSHYLAIIFFFIVGLIMVSQQFLARVDLGGDYKGLYYVYDSNNVDAYIAKMKEITEGHYLVSSPYFYEYKNNTQYVLPVGEYIYLLPHFLLGISLMSTMIFNQFFFPALLFIAVYFFIFKILAQDSFGAKLSSVCGGLLVVLGYNFNTVSAVLDLLRGTQLYQAGVIWNRPVNPVTGVILLFIFLLAVWKIINDQKMNKKMSILAGIVLGLTIGYFFTWFLAMSIIGIMLLIHLFQRSYVTVKKILIIIFVNFLVTAPYWMNVIRLLVYGGGDNRAARNGAFFNHSPVINKFLTLAFIVFLVLMFIEYRRGKIKTWHWFCFALLAGGEAAYNQQIITGINVWHPHFVQFTIPVVFAVFIIVLHNYVRPFSDKIWKLTILLLMLGSIMMGVNNSRQYLSNRPNFRHFQEYGDVFKWFNDNAAKECVIFVNEKGEELVRFIPGFTHCNTYTAPGGYDLEVPEARRYHNFLTLLRIWGVDPKNAGDYLRKNYLLINEYFFADWDQALSMVYESRMEDTIKKAADDYAEFAKKNFEQELKTYKLDYVLSEGALPEPVKNILLDAKLIETINGQFFIYKL